MWERKHALSRSVHVSMGDLVNDPGSTQIGNCTVGYGVGSSEGSGSESNCDCVLGRSQLCCHSCTSYGCAVNCHCARGSNISTIASNIESLALRTAAPQHIP